MKMNMRWQAGVTLFELMVTVAIIAILAGIAIPLYHGYMQSGYVSKCNNEVAAIKLAEEEYYLKNNAYFPTPAGSSVTTALTNTYGNNPIEIASGGNASPNSFSGGTYVSSYDSTSKLQNANCLYTVTSQANPPSYTITLSGVKNLASKGANFATYTK